MIKNNKPYEGKLNDFQFKLTFLNKCDEKNTWNESYEKI